MMSTPVPVGNRVPLTLLVDDGTTGLYVRATVKDRDGDTVLATKTLTEQGSGLYTDESFFMPDQDFIIVVYEVFYDAGLTLSAKDEHRNSETVFSRADDLQGTAQSRNDADIIVTLIDDSIEAQVISDPTLVASVESDPTLVAAVLDDESIEGVVSSDTIEGEVTE